MRRAFTLIECMICVGIVGILAGILLPVFASAKHQAKIRASLSNLHQASIALSLYQVDYGCDGVYGDAGAMGFPDLWFFAYRPYGAPESLFRTPCGQNFQWENVPVVIQYDLFPLNLLLPGQLGKLSPVYRENLPTFDDLNCTDDYEDLHNPLLAHRGLAVSLGGALLDVKQPGNIDDIAWWTKPPDM